jgi:hypothetical protein
MSTKPIEPQLSPRQMHVRQRTWQIWVPFGVAGLIVLAALVYAILLAAGMGGVSEWADVSLILLILPGLVMTLVFVAITGGLAFLVTVAIRKLPKLTARIMGVLLKLQNGVNTFSKKAAQPFITVSSWQAGLRRLKRSVSGKPDPAG